MKRFNDPLFAPERRRHPALTFTLLLLLVLVVTILVMNHVSNSRVNLLSQTVSIAALPSSLENFRILHISDLHGQFFGAHQERLALTLANARYNIVCITGDVTGKDGSIDAFLDLLDLFQGKAPVYFIPGDEDPPAILATPHGNPSAKADYILAAEAHGAIYLDAPEKISVGNATIWLSPERSYTLDIPFAEAALTDRLEELKTEAETPDREAAITAVQYQLEQLDRVRAARRETTEDDIHIALTHHPLLPDMLQSLQEWTATDNDAYVRFIALVLAGHYVGGQWRLPVLGAVRVPASAGKGDGWFPGDTGVLGLSSFHGIFQYISPGLGASAAIGLPGFRLFNIPAVTVLRLTSKLTD